MDVFADITTAYCVILTVHVFTYNKKKFGIFALYVLLRIFLLRNVDVLSLIHDCMSFFTIQKSTIKCEKITQYKVQLINYVHVNKIID